MEKGSERCSGRTRPVVGGVPLLPMTDNSATPRGLDVTARPETAAAGGHQARRIQTVLEKELSFNLTEDLKRKLEVDRQQRLHSERMSATFPQSTSTLQTPPSSSSSSSGNIHSPKGTELLVLLPRCR